MYYDCDNVNNLATDNLPALTFTEENMVSLLTAYKSLRDLEKLLSMIAGIDPSEGFLRDLQHMDYLIQDLSPLYDHKLDYDKQVFTIILEDNSLSISEKAHILSGSKDEYGIQGIEQVSTAFKIIMKHEAMGKSSPQHMTTFTVDNMIDLLTAYYGYSNLSAAIKLFAGTYPNHKILLGLGHLDNLLAHLSPLYNYEYDDDDIKNKKYLDILHSCYMGLQEKACLLMGETLS